MEDECPHRRVAPGTDVEGTSAEGKWLCVYCGEEFVPLQDVGPLVATISAENTQQVVQLSAALIWELHQHAKANQPLGDAPTAETLDEALKVDPEKCEHKFTNGACSVCGTSQFLGGS